MPSCLLVTPHPHTLTLAPHVSFLTLYLFMWTRYMTLHSELLFFLT